MIKQMLIDILKTICPNVYLQGTLDPDKKYPADFITFFVNSTDDESFYNNGETAVWWTVSVMYYSTSPVKVNTIPAEIRIALKNSGFIPTSHGNDLMSDDPEHTGWVCEFLYRQII